MPHPSAPRNPNIANVFFKAGYVESWGRGYKNITDICQFRNAKLPEPQENSGGLMVECPASDKYLKLANELKVDRVNDGVNELPQNFPKTSPKLPQNCPIPAQKTYLAIVENSSATLSELSMKVGVSERSIKTHISLLKDAGLIERVGSNKSGYWIIIEKE